MYGWAHRWPWALAALAGAATCLALAALPGAAEAKCERAVVAGKKVCLKPGQRCRAVNQEDYVRAGFSCRRGRLQRASAEELRGDEPLLIEKGKLSLDTALAAFDEAIAPMPGVKADPGEVGELDSATLVFEAIGTRLDELSARQRAAYEEAIAPAPDGVTVDPSGPRRAPATIEEQQIARTYVSTALQVYRGHGFFPSKQIHISFLDDQGTAKPTVHAYVPPDDVPHSGSPVTPTCNIFMTRFGRSQPEERQQKTLFHETAHCVQHSFYSSYADYDRVPQWVKEGGADWMAGAAITELGDDPVGMHWIEWLGSPATDLEKRSYGGLGFFSMIQQSGVDTWLRMRQVLQAAATSGKNAAYDAAIAGLPDAFFDRWGPGFARAPTAGSSFDFTGPGITSSEPAKLTISNGAVRSQTADARAANAARLDIRADVFTVRTKKSTRGLIADSGGKSRKLKQGAYCAKPGGCKCKTSANLELPTIGRGIAHAGFGGDRAKSTSVIYSGLSVGQYCKKPSPGPAHEESCTRRATARQASCPLPPPGIAVNELTEDGDIGPLLATFKRGDCTSGGDFVAIATDGDYRLEVGIQDYRGFDNEYFVRSGIPDPEVVVDGPKGTFGNTQFSVPGNPGLGGIALDEKGDMGLGLVPAHNADATAAVSIAGGMDCEYPDER